MSKKKSKDEPFKDKAEGPSLPESEAVPKDAGAAADAEEPLSGEEPYPLRAPSEDPRWAVVTVWIWIAFAGGMLIFITVLLILGAIYD